MKIDSLLYKIKLLLPKNLVFWLRKLLYLLKKFHPKISKVEILQILTTSLGIKKGSVVFIHSSIDKLYLNFSYSEFFKLLLEIVGTEGTIIFPSSQIKTRAEDYLNSSPNIIFDVKKTPSIRGLLSELARREKGAIRSLHPTNSVVAIGKLAKELLEEHHMDVYPCGKYSPFYKITQHNGIIIGLGVDTEYLTFVHAVEDVMGDKFPIKTRDDKVFECKVKDLTGNLLTIKTLVAHKRIRFRNVPDFIKKNISRDICNDFTYKGVKFFRADSEKLCNEMKHLATKNKTIYSKKAYLI